MRLLADQRFQPYPYDRAAKTFQIDKPFNPFSIFSPSPLSELGGMSDCGAFANVKSHV